MDIVLSIIVLLSECHIHFYHLIVSYCVTGEFKSCPPFSLEMHVSANFRDFIKLRNNNMNLESLTTCT